MAATAGGFENCLCRISLGGCCWYCDVFWVFCCKVDRGTRLDWLAEEEEGTRREEEEEEGWMATFSSSSSLENMALRPEETKRQS